MTRKHMDYLIWGAAVALLMVGGYFLLCATGCASTAETVLGGTKPLVDTNGDNVVSNQEAKEAVKNTIEYVPFLPDWAKGVIASAAGLALKAGYDWYDKRQLKKTIDTNVAAVEEAEKTGKPVKEVMATKTKEGDKVRKQIKAAKARNAKAEKKAAIKAAKKL